MRELANQLNDSRAEYLQAQSDGLLETLNQADTFFKSVKQTSDATIDSRILVQTGDLSYKKTTQLVLGDGATGIEVDDFVFRCIAYMRSAPSDDDGLLNQTQHSSSQRNRRRPTQRTADSDAEDEDESEDFAYDWSYLGSSACFPYNSRPCVSGFLLGPLSLQKRARIQSQRRARQPRANLADVMRPTQLTTEDIEASHETANLTQICDGISKLLRKVQADGQERVEAEVDDDMTEDEVLQIMQEHGVSDDGGVPLMHFCVNPKSFGQTVENLFYVSFLIKEGAAGINFDSTGLPTLHPHQPTAPQEAQVKGVTKNQAVFALDFQTWEDLVHTFGLTESLIPHRQEEEYDDGTIETT
ncbi:putative nuclear protein qri2 nse4 [Phaeomoniella chlamydospora]|uniref:Non-structural maintenance of chromosomes element 4 n=1 Tax=Phaeomoniella chlamydospora TaxID=158046 RepID=A0A0G2GQN2_PHACM|nr:putative nuclear protein qri2 nse4 [Phaeomoniella chlamydospora]